MSRVFANSVFQAANISACHTDIVRIDPRMPVPSHVQAFPHSLERRSLCCGGQYARWLSCIDLCHPGAGNRKRRHDALSYVTDDVLVTMQSAIIDPLMNNHGLCGPMTLDHRCVLNAMHWDSRRACEVVMKSRARSHVDKLGIVSTVYAGAPGHFPQETVPTWLRLLHAMPRSVPLWIPESSIARRYATYIGSVLGLEAGRFVHARGPISVDQLYLYRPSPRYSGKPMNRPLTIRSRDDFLLMRTVLRPRNPPGRVRPSTLLLINREGSRALANNQSVATDLHRISLDLGLEFEIRTLGRSPLLEDAVAFRSARAVVGVHGAGLANIVFCSDNVSIVEIGYATGMPMPEIYFDQARFLGLRYWAVAGRGSYNGQVTVNASALANTVALAVSSENVTDA